MEVEGGGEGLRLGWGGWMGMQSMVDKGQG